MDKQISTTQQLNKLIEFRQVIYEQVLLKARDTQFESAVEVKRDKKQIIAP